MEKSKQWFVVYTRIGQEQKVCGSFHRRKMDSFYPVNRLVKTSPGKERVSFKPLLERYVFVYAMPNQIQEVKKIGGIVSLVHWLSQPVVIDEEDIYLMKRFCKMHDDIQLEKIKVISSEPAFISSCYSENDTELVSFHFPVLGYNMLAEERKTHVKVITTDYQIKPATSNNQYAEAR